MYSLYLYEIYEINDIRILFAVVKRKVVDQELTYNHETMFISRLPLHFRFTNILLVNPKKLLIFLIYTGCPTKCMLHESYPQYVSTFNVVVVVLQTKFSTFQYISTTVISTREKHSWVTMIESDCFRGGILSIHFVRPVRTSDIYSRWNFDY